MNAITPASVAESDDPRGSPFPSSSFKSGTAIILYLALARIVLYSFAAPHYGYFRDELYYLACGQHPAWGYVDQPPLIAWTAWLLEHSIGTSLWALRLLPALAGAAAIVLSGLLARELGGSRWAMFLASLAALLAPVSLELSQLFTMNAFDPVLWTAIAYLLVRVASSASSADERDGNGRLWLAIGALVGISIMNKYAILFWIAGVIAGMCVTPLRQHLRHLWFWLACLLAAAIAWPNFLWQWRHQFPFLQLMHNVRQEGRDIALSPLPYLEAQARMLGFVAALLVLLALLFFFSKRGRQTRALGWAYLIFLGEMMFLHGKMYYVAPVYPIMFAAGAVWLEGATRRKLWLWAKPAFALATTVVCALYLPMVLPILSVPHFLAYERTVGVQQQKFEHQPLGVLPQIYADMFGWEGMTQRVAAFYHTLSPEEQRKTAIVGGNYGEAAAIDFFGPKYGLPKAIGGHQNYWIWGPRQYTGESLILLGEGRESVVRNECASYSIVGNTKDPLSIPYEWEPIYYCRGLKWNLQAGWPRVKRWE